MPEQFSPESREIAVSPDSGSPIELAQEQGNGVTLSREPCWWRRGCDGKFAQYYSVDPIALVNPSVFTRAFYGCMPKHQGWEYYPETVTLPSYTVHRVPHLPEYSGLNTNFSEFLGTPNLKTSDMASQVYLGLNLAHARAQPVCQALTYYTSSLLDLPVTRELAGIGSSGSEANAAAITIANLCHQTLGSGRRGVIRSYGAHLSAADPDHISTFVVPLDPQTGQMRNDLLLRMLKEQKPAALLLTMGRTEDGVFEQVSEEVRAYCKKEGIVIIHDLTLYPRTALLPDEAAFPNDPSPRIKAAYRAACRSCPADILVTEVGKTIGSPGIAQIFFGKEVSDIVLSEAKNHLSIAHRKQAVLSHVDSSTKQPTSIPYFTPLDAEGVMKQSWNTCPIEFLQIGTFSATTLLAERAVRFIRTIETYGPYHLSFLATAALQTTCALAQRLNSLGIETFDIRDPSLVVPLRSAEEATAVSRDLAVQFNIEVSKTSQCGYGLHIILPFDQIAHPEHIEYLSTRINESIRATRGEPRPRGYMMEAEDLTELPGQYQVTTSHLASLMGRYSGPIATLPSGTSDQPFRTIVKAYQSLQCFEYLSGVPTYLLRLGVMHTVNSVSSHEDPKQERADARRILKSIVRYGMPESLTVENVIHERYNRDLIQHVGNLLNAVRWARISSRRARTVLILEALDQLSKSLSPCVETMIERRKPIPFDSYINEHTRMPVIV